MKPMLSVCSTPRNMWQWTWRLCIICMMPKLKRCTLSVYFSIIWFPLFLPHSFGCVSRCSKWAAATHYFSAILKTCVHIRLSSDSDILSFACLEHKVHFKRWCFTRNVYIRINFEKIKSLCVQKSNKMEIASNY